MEKAQYVITSGEVTSSNTSGNFGFGGKEEKFTVSSSSTSEDSGSSKGLKAGTEITIDSGNIQITSTDDSIHSNGIIIINDGTMKLSSGDDGIHADTNIAINGGNIDITKSYEGIESGYIEINGGTGMWQNPSNNSTQYSLTFQTSGNSGDEIVLKDSSGKEIACASTVDVVYELKK